MNLSHVAEPSRGPQPEVESGSFRGWLRRGTPLEFNEDAVVATARTFCVIDGAKPIDDRLVCGVSSAAFLAKTASQLIATNGKESQSIARCLIEVNGDYAEELFRYSREMYDRGKERPASSISGIRIHEGGTFSWAVASEVPVFAFCRDRSVRTFGTPYPSDNERARLALIAKGLQEGHDLNELIQRSDYQRLWRAHVNGRNVDRAVFNGEGPFQRLLQSGEESLEPFEGFLLMSDGMEWPGKAGIEGLVAAAHRIWEVGVQGYYNELTALLDADPEFKKYPRFKHLDDASAVLVRL